MINFAIIGVQKTATTYLSNLINSSSKVYMPIKEFIYFDDQNFEKHGNKNIKKIITKGKHKIIGIKRPRLLFSSNARDNLYRHNPKIKLIVLLRNPIDRFVSAYYHFLRLSFIPLKPINKFLDDLRFTDAANYDAILEACPNKASKDLLLKGLFSRGIKNYLQVFDRKQLLIIVQNELKNEIKLLDKISSFLEIKLDKKKMMSFQKNEGVYNKYILKFVRFKNIFTHEINLKYLTRREYKNIFSRAINLFFVGFQKLFLVKILKNQPDKLTKESRLMLERFYKKDQDEVNGILRNEA
tara:strand:+ start:13947 stop:14837 length:891 start_codon:yes stop_codon:yes gene_type:complete